MIREKRPDQTEREQTKSLRGMSLRRLFFFMDIIEFLKRSYLGDKRCCSKPVREIFPFRFACYIAVQLIICPTPKSNTPKDKAFRPRIILPRKSDASSPLASDTMKSLSIPSRKDHRYSGRAGSLFSPKTGRPFRMCYDTDNELTGELQVLFTVCKRSRR